jgi:hypothetical protein
MPLGVVMTALLGGLRIELNVIEAGVQLGKTGRAGLTLRNERAPVRSSGLQCPIGERGLASTDGLLLPASAVPNGSAYIVTRRRCNRHGTDRIDPN